MGTKEFNVIHTYGLALPQREFCGLFFGKLNKGLIGKFRIV